MFVSLKDKIPWPSIRAHTSSLAVALSLNSFVRVPRDTFRYGGISYLLLYTFFCIFVALPICLLQLSIGRLSQQDAVGVWKAVPFFKGVGYIKLLTSFASAMWTIIYTALVGGYFLNTMRSSMPFKECEVHNTTQIEGYENFTASACLQQTFMAPVREQPEYYVVIGMIVVLLWSVSPFILYSPRYMKRIFYIVGPLLLLLSITVAASLGQASSLSDILTVNDWNNLIEPYIWFGSLIQALMSTQVGTGFLFSVSDSLYSTTNVQWTSITFVLLNVVAGWITVICWFCLGVDEEKDKSIFSVIVVVYKFSEKRQLNNAWPLVIYLTFFIAGITSMVIYMYPIYDRLRRMAEDSWRRWAIAISVVGGLIALTILAGRENAIKITDEVIVPILLSFGTLLEMSAFIFIYGWKLLLEDIAFLTGNQLSKVWTISWRGVSAFILPFFIWWTTAIFLLPIEWTIQSWQIWLITTYGIVFLIFIIFAILSISRQVQYDLVAKVKSSFKPSRHWGPRDPITHYYWLARRQDIQLDTGSGVLSPAGYSGWRLGQMSEGQSLKHSTSTLDKEAAQNLPQVKPEIKRRANSDDWLYTRFRKKAATYFGFDNRPRSKSLDSSFSTSQMKFENKNWNKNERVTDARNEVIDVICYIKRPKQSLSSSSRGLESDRRESNENIDADEYYIKGEHVLDETFKIPAHSTFKASQENLTKF